ncbi:hypothetical protein SUGI_0350370 [Cryptomeria japonica]|nr:hypothetical protein SUGI_0350370 [Cryptomeria japonica]
MPSNVKPQISTCTGLVMSVGHGDPLLVVKEKYGPEGLLDKKDNPSKSSKLTSPTEKQPMWASFIQSGDTFLSFVDNYIQKSCKKVDLFESGGQVLTIISAILEDVGKVHWAVAGLSVIGYLLAKVGKMSDNRDECLQLLQYMLDLAVHIEKLRGLVPHEKEKLKNALVIIVKGSMLCAKQLSSKKFFSFLKSSLDSKNLSSLRSEIHLLYPDLKLTAVIAILQQKQQPKRLPVTQSDYPPHADPHKNDIKKMQEQILKDGFPSHNSGKSINFRDTEEGKKCLKEAFKKDKNPVFLYIDNALREEELSELLPEGLEDLGKHIRLLLTTRNLSATNVFKKKFRQEYLVEPLQNTDAKKVLCKDAKNLDRIKDDVDEILNICDGVPLVLKIVGAHLENQGFKKDNCNQILSALKKGEVIKEKDLSRCMVDFVFKTLEESTQEAFLDICCFFHLFPRTSVEYAVGSMEVKALEGAALIKFKVIPEYYAPMQKHEELVLVHDVIKEKGRNMARLNRIRGIKSFEAAVAEKRLESIKGIDLFLNKDHSSYVLEKEHLNSMSKSLRFLKLGPKIKVSAPSETTFPELRYLYLSDIFSCVPFHSEALETLAVYVGHLPNDNCICKLPRSLHRINIFKPDPKCIREQSKPIKMPPHSCLEELFVNSLSMKTLPVELQSFKALEQLA